MDYIESILNSEEFKSLVNLEIKKINNFSNIDNAKENIFAILTDSFSILSGNNKLINSRDFFTVSISNLRTPGGYSVTLKRKKEKVKTVKISWI